MHISPLRFRQALVMAALLLGAGGAVGGVAAASGTTRTGAAVSSKPALVLVHRNPAVVRGTGFRSRRRVRVTLVAGHSYVARPVANRLGRFTATFATVVDRCTVWLVTAVEPGAAPVVLHGPKPECAPAATP
jgi:hypothetical protein